MKPIEVSNIGPARPIHSALTETSASRAGSAGRRPDAPVNEPAMVSRSEQAQAGATPPIDAARVTEIKTAIREGRYPLVPTRVADAMVAVGYLLSESPEKN